MRSYNLACESYLSPGALRRGFFLLIRPVGESLPALDFLERQTAAVSRANLIQISAFQRCVFKTRNEENPLIGFGTKAPTPVAGAFFCCAVRGSHRLHPRFMSAAATGRNVPPAIRRSDEPIRPGNIRVAENLGVVDWVDAVKAARQHTSASAPGVV